MSIETSIDALTTQTTGLLEVCVSLKNNAAQAIADAVVVSQNGALIPLISMAANLVDSQALLVTLISRMK